ncbi:MAG: Ig-like domain-containing protein [Candidatus Bipolaricaulota bacterium]|nr:Ig-like domain-containing protein [Candidatus Bipolaricaulota bacterium]
MHRRRPARGFEKGAKGLWMIGDNGVRGLAAVGVVLSGLLLFASLVGMADPIVTGVSASDSLITDGDVPGPLTVAIDFDVAMNTSIPPMLVFAPGVSSTLSLLPGGSWTDSDTYTATYSVADGNVDVDSVTVDVTGARDASGNLQQDYTPLAEFDIDTQNPAAPSVPDLAGASDLGESNTDDVTRDSTPTFDGSAESDSTVEVSSSISGSLGTTTAPGGAWTFTVLGSAPLVDGIHNISARATDGAGNVGSWSTVLAVRIDTQVPPAPGDRNPADWTRTNDNTPTFSWTAPIDPGDSGIRDYRIVLTGPSSRDSYPEATTYTPTSLPDGSYTWYIYARDVAGNTGPSSATWNLDIDTQNPTVTVAIVDASLYDGDPSSSVTFTFSEATTNFVVGDLTLVGGTISGFGGSGTSYTATFTATDGVDVIGSVTVDAGSYTDAAGNLGSTGSDTVDIDTQNPTVTIVANDVAICDGDVGVDYFTVTATFSEAMSTGVAPSVAFSPDPTQAPATFTNPSGAWGGTGGNTAYTWTYDIVDVGVTVPDVGVTVSGGWDVAGNAQVVNTNTDYVDIDTRKPRSTVTTDHTLTADGSPIYEGSLMLTVTVTYDEAMNTSTTPAITLQNAGTHWGAQTSLGWTVGGTVYQATFTHNGTEEPTPPVPALVAFARVSNASGATDLAGNTDVGADSPTFEIDTRKPELTPGVAAVAIDTDPVYEGDLTQRVTVTFDEAMDTGTTPAIVFGHGTWTTNHDGVWSSGCTIWTVTYTLADHDEEYYSLTGSVVTVDVVGARDAAGNLQEPYAAEPEFDIDTLQPQITEFTSVPDGGCHVAGDTIDITVAFSESVFGALTLNLDSGGIVDVLGVVSNDSETRTYTIQWGENSCDLDVESAVVDAGGDLVDWAGNYAHWTGGATNLSLPTGHNLADNSAVIADTTIPIAVTDPDEDETRSGVDSDIVEVRLDPQGRYRLMVRQDTPVYIDVLANDIELPCLSHLSVYDFPVLPTYGTIPDENPANPVRYAPYAGYIGPDEFTYRAVDACGNISVEATVYVEVIPQLVFADVYVTACAAASVAIDVAATDLFVPPGAPEDAEFAFEIVEGPEHGIVAGDPTEVEITEPGTSTLFIESATVKFIYAPASGFVGRDQFRVRFSDPFGGARTAVIDIEVQKCPWVEEAPLVIPQGALLPLIVPLSFASVYETAWDAVTLTGEDGTEHPQALLATWNESLERPTLVVDTGPLALGVYELVISLGNGEIVTLRFAVGEKP